jgi:hypothetical protein
MFANYVLFYFPSSVEYIVSVGKKICVDSLYVQEQ